jgi:hypothetical protein
VCGLSNITLIDRNRLVHGDVFSTQADPHNQYVVIRSDTRGSYNSHWLQIDHLFNGSAFMLDLRLGGVYESKRPAEKQLWNVGRDVILVSTQLADEPLAGMDYSQDIVPRLEGRLTARVGRDPVDNAILDVPNCLRLIRGPNAYLYFDLVEAYLHLVETNDLKR